MSTTRLHCCQTTQHLKRVRIHPHARSAKHPNSALGGGLKFADENRSGGPWLRRQRRAMDSRAPLRAARDTFDALGATPWGDRARQELRASGERSSTRRIDASQLLSSQEFQVAEMAASGLSNREIAQRLFLSHRTVGAHLYRIYPSSVSRRVTICARR